MTNTGKVQANCPHPAWEVIWWIVLGIWTIGLLRPEPIRLGNEWVPPGAGWYLAKGSHLGMYLLLGFSRLALAGRPPINILLVILLLIHGALTEYFQQWVALRHGSMQDVLVDWLGVFSGCFSYLFWLKRWNSPVPAPLNPEQEQNPGKE